MFVIVFPLKSISLRNENESVYTVLARVSCVYSLLRWSFIMSYSMFIGIQVTCSYIESLSLYRIHNDLCIINLISYFIN